MKKNIIITISLCALILTVSIILQAKVFGPKSQEKAIEAQQAYEKQQEEQAKIAEKNALESMNVNSVLKKNENIETKTEQNYTITTNKARVTFTNKGGDIVSYIYIDEKGNEIEMADNVTENNRALSVNFGNSHGLILNEIFNVKQIDDYTIGFYKDYSIKDKDEKVHVFTLAKLYTFKEDEEVFKLDLSLISKDDSNALDIGGASYTLRTSPQIGPKVNKKDRYDIRQYVAYNGSKKQIKNMDNKLYNKPWTWVGAAGKYFCMLVSPVNPQSMVLDVRTATGNSSVEKNAQVFVSRNPVTEKSVNDTYYIYVGPRNEASLIKYNNKDKNEWHLFNMKFNEALQSGTFTRPIEIALKCCLEMIFKLVKNWGVAIIILTFLIKILLFPLNLKSSLGSIKMQEIQPKMQAIQAKYKDNQVKLSEETQKLYKESGYNPMSGCLPMIIQMFILIALYRVFSNYYEFRGASFIKGWIDDLSIGDSIFSWSKKIPLTGWMQNNIRLLPIIYVVSQFISSKISQGATPATNTSSQMNMKLMMYLMPLMFFFMFYNFASGLMLYWATSNIIQIVQQLIINIVMKKKREESLNNAPKVNANVLKFKGGKKKPR